MYRRPRTSPLFPYTTLFRSPALRSVGRVQRDHATRVAGKIDVPASAGDRRLESRSAREHVAPRLVAGDYGARGQIAAGNEAWRSEEHTSELQSHSDLVCRLL